MLPSTGASPVLMPWPPPVDAALDSLDDVELSSVSGSGQGTSCDSSPGCPIFGLRLTVGLGALAQPSLGHSSFVQNVSCAMSMNSPSAPLFVVGIPKCCGTFRLGGHLA